MPGLCAYYTEAVLIQAHMQQKNICQFLLGMLLLQNLY